jgi:hypothetical protein
MTTPTPLEKQLQAEFDAVLREHGFETGLIVTEADLDRALDTYIRNKIGLVGASTNGGD